MAELLTRTRLVDALPFWISLTIPPVLVFAAVQGGWALALPIIATWVFYDTIDFIAGLNEENLDPDTPDDRLRWYTLVTLVWTPIQFALVFGLIWYVAASGHLSALEQAVLFVGVGIATGAVGINYAHELMHQSSRLERWLADILLAMVLYSHFRSEHLLVHHRHVGTPRDAVTARYNEGFHRFFFRVLPQCLVSAFRAERDRQSRKGHPWWHASNPFWRYWALQAGFLALAAALGGWQGVGLFALQAFVAIWHLELTNYVEHYGLVRLHLGNGKYEHVRPRHSWNATHRVTNWFLINLQRHSDHHYKPDRRYPLLQTYDETEAPHLPFSYGVMNVFAMIPPLWRRLMNPRVRMWRKVHYPEVTDWVPYYKGGLPMPR